MSKPLSRRRIEALRTMPAEQKVRIYSVQDLGAWEAAQQRGYWTGSYEHITAEEHNYLKPYEWMREQMAKRIEGYSGDFPMWGFFLQPNMRRRCFFTEPTVMLVADVPRGRMLISDFDWWHTPLNNWYCATSEEEDDAFDAHHQGGVGPSTVNQVMRDTWERIFDLSPRAPEVLPYIGVGNVLQTCIDRIYLNEVVRVRPVTGRLGRNGGKTW